MASRESTPYHLDKVVAVDAGPNVRRKCLTAKRRRRSEAIKSQTRQIQLW